MSKSTDAINTIRTSWGSGNDGAGSGLDADSLDGLSSEDFVFTEAPVAGTPLEGLIVTGLYPITGATPVPILKADGHLTVTSNTIYVTQLWSNDTELAIRHQVVATGVWTAWKQLGTMTFDGTVLEITL